MAKRIVEETLKNGDKQYRVETNKFLGFKTKWHTDISFVPTYDSNFEAVFDNLTDAIIHCGIDINPVINRRILNEKDL